MKQINKSIELQETIETYHKEGKRIGLVPTMGALHSGHASLVRECVLNNDVCVVSIFVNPTQFNNKEDLEKYPRTVKQDITLLSEISKDIIVFAPAVEEVYPEPDNRQFDFGQLDKVMEGKYRPGHFNGVAQVVSKLFTIVKPDRAYFGEKDFQQLAIIRAMVEQLNFRVEIIPIPIVRENSGLALSSRNERLSTQQKVVATNIYKTLKESLEWKNSHSVEAITDMVIAKINAHKELRVEYFEIVDGLTLQPIKSWTESDYVVGCITVFCGNVRLIDNILYKA